MKVLMKGLAGKTAIVTGGGRGIGRAIAKRLAFEGCNVAIFDLNGEGASETVRLIKADSPASKTLVAAIDVANPEAIASSLGDVERELGSIDILVNNVGWDQAIPFVKTDFAFWKKVIDINLYSALHMHHAVLPKMIAKGGGKVVNIASDAGRVGSSGEAVYAACKGGLIAFTKTLARELARNNIQLNTVCPGPTDTPLFASFIGDTELGPKIRDGLRRAIPLGRLGDPEDYPGIVALLASDDANFITGQTISVSGGLTMA